MRRGGIYQLALIFLGLVATAFLGVFAYREFAPEYLIYQDEYVTLEKFRSSYTGKPPPPFSRGVKQILIERQDKGPPTIDRCTSCHVAVQFPQFSPTKIARDINGNILYDADGIPVKIPNDDYVWGRLDDKITELKASGKSDGLAQAKEYESLKNVQVGEYVYDVTKVLKMHPLMGRETRPFEYHSPDQYGCTSCHNGNGRGLVTDRAHGPVFDGQYETEFTGPTPQFVQLDPGNDPKFARVFNHEPGDRLVFQVNPLYVGGLIEAKCIQCHLTSQGLLQKASASAGLVAERNESSIEVIKTALKNEESAAISIVALLKSLSSNGLDKTLKNLQNQESDYTLPEEQLDAITAQAKFIEQYKNKPQELNKDLNKRLVAMAGSEALAKEMESKIASSKNPQDAIEAFIKDKSADPNATGSLFTKTAAIQFQNGISKHISDVESSFVKAANDQDNITKIQTEVDRLLSHYNHGYELYISEACYACHKIAGMARGGVGPELTQEGKSAYPWFIKKKLVWPQGTLPTSTMPNMKLDHVELEDLTTFILAQVGQNSAISDTAYRTWVQEWESGKKLPWEELVSPAKVHDLRFGMTVFATEGCSACHRLKGYEGDVGFTLEKGKPSFDQVYSEHEWFKKLFPEDIEGDEIVKVLETNSAEIDKRISPDVRKGTILTEIDENYPGIIEAIYTPFRYAERSKNRVTENKLGAAKTNEEKEAILKENEAWKERIKRVRMMYVQEYGLGRLIGPVPNWSGIYRTDEWLMEHFKNPQSHVPRSIMPVFPFDESKFYTLTYMLDVIGKKNRQEVQAIWDHKGFDPELAVEIHCAHCHGPNLLGNGPIAQWIYPIPKNLRRPDFLRNLTRERVIDSITHGVNGTPMPPWGESHKNKPEGDNLPELSESQIDAIADWLFSQLPGNEVIKSSNDVPKWNYKPEDVIKDLKNEGNQEKFEKGKGHPIQELQDKSSMLNTSAPLIAALDPGSTDPSNDVTQIFREVPNPKGPEPFSYYIKKEYYSQANLQAGEAFFAENCAVCHGKDADGSGTRAEAMVDAKPRMLTNLDWLDSRDDLRLLRSIKYGVPGTAMVPWGDLTSSMQRLQLVMYIRSLSTARNYQEELGAQLYRTFEDSRLAIEKARINEYQHIEPLQKAYDQANAERKKLSDKFGTEKVDSKDILNSYQKELEIEGELNSYLAIDDLYKELRVAIDKERSSFSDIGSQITNNEPVGQEFADFLGALNLMEGEFEYKEGSVKLYIDSSKEAKIKTLEDNILILLKQRIDTVQASLKSNSAEAGEDASTLNAKLVSLNKLNKSVIAGFEMRNRSLKEQQELLNKIDTKIKAIRGNDNNSTTQGGKK